MDCGFLQVLHIIRISQKVEFSVSVSYYRPKTQVILKKIYHITNSKLFKDCEFLQVLQIIHISQKVEFSVSVNYYCINLDIELKVNLLNGKFLQRKGFIASQS